MENLSYQFKASAKVAVLQRQVLVGVVGSGDLEVLLEPQSDQIDIQVCTSVDGMAQVWEALMQRLFATAVLPPMCIEINDFGATPGVVRLRLEQALEEVGLSVYED